MSEAEVRHESILLKEAVGFLNVKKEGVYLDATLGGGGHTLEILGRGGIVLGIDRDPEALKRARELIGDSPHFKAVLGNFRELDEISQRNGHPLLDGIIFDLGISAFQLKTPGRGFSFLKDDVLDMRASPDSKLTAKDVIRDFSESELYEVFVKFGEERLSSRLADALVRQRSVNPIQTTGDLYRIIRSLVRSEAEGRRVAARVFQALRILVNDELRNLREALPRALGILRCGGRLVVISFHSLEDRVVKNFFLEAEKRWEGSILTKKPVLPGPWERRANPSACSAKLRALEKTYG